MTGQKLGGDTAQHDLILPWTSVGVVTSRGGTRVSKRFLRLRYHAIGPVLLLLFGTANAATMNLIGEFRFATQAAYSNYWPFRTCDGTSCHTLSDSGGQAYTSDYAVGQQFDIFNATDGEVFTWKATHPDGSMITTVTTEILTYNLGTNCWSDNHGNQWCGGPLGYIRILVGVLVACQQTGSWSFQAFDNGALVQTTSFTLSHNSSGPIGIISPTDNQLFQLTQSNYTGSETVPFSAGTNGSGSISWTATLHYLSSGGYGGPDPAPRTFTTASGAEHDETYQSIGGQVKVTAQTTTSIGTVQDCVTFYVEGPEGGGIPNPTITSRLDSLYSTGATPNLMTGIAMKESSYSQFRTPLESNPDLFNLYATFQIAAKWPYESYDGGSHIGLMMVPTTGPLAWDWLQDTNDAVNSADHGFVAMKLPRAQTIMNWMINGSRQNNVPAHPGLPSFSSPSVELENMALILYGPFASSDWTMQYYAPICAPPGVVVKKGNTWTCKGGSWTWAVNATGNPGGVNYANTVRSLMQ